MSTKYQTYHDNDPLIAEGTITQQATAVQNQQPNVSVSVNQRAFPIRKLKMFGGVQLVLGILICLISVIAVIIDVQVAIYTKCYIPDYPDYPADKNLDFWKCQENVQRNQTIFCFDILCFLLSLLCIFAGCQPLCHPGRIIGITACNIIGAAFSAPTLVGLSVSGAALRGRFSAGWIILPALIAVLSFAELVIQIVSSSYCCCGWPWGTMSYLNTMPPGADVNPQYTEGPIMIGQPTVGMSGNELGFYSNLQQNQAIAPNQSTQQFQSNYTNQPGADSTQQSQAYDTDVPPAYKALIMTDFIA